MIMHKRHLTNQELFLKALGELAKPSSIKTIAIKAGVGYEEGKNAKNSSLSLLDYDATGRDRRYTLNAKGHQRVYGLSRQVWADSLYLFNKITYCRQSACL